MRDVNFYGLLDASDLVIDTFLRTTYPAIAHAISPLLTIVLVLYWVVLGMRIYTGYAAIDWTEILNRAFMSVAVLSVLVWGALAHQIYDAFLGLTEEMCAAIVAGKTAASLLDELWRSVGSVSAVLMGDQLSNIGITLQGFGLFILNGMLFVIIVALMASAKFGLCATMLLLPVFAAFALFKVSRQWAMNWIGMMLQCALLYVFVVAIVQVGFLMFEEPVNKIIRASKHAVMADLDVAKITYIYLMEGVLIVFLLQARSWAATLSRSLCVQGGVLIQRDVVAGAR